MQIHRSVTQSRSTDTRGPRLVKLRHPAPSPSPIARDPVAVEHRPDLTDGADAQLTWLALDEGIGGVVAFGVALYLARVLGAQQFGLLGSTFALVTYFRIFVVGGIDYKGVHDIAGTPSAISDIWASTPSPASSAFPS